jgi:hypothetical protein
MEIQALLDELHAKELHLLLERFELNFSLYFDTEDTERTPELERRLRKQLAQLVACAARLLADDDD